MYFIRNYTILLVFNCFICYSNYSNDIFEIDQTIDVWYLRQVFWWSILFAIIIYLYEVLICKKLLEFIVKKNIDRRPKF